MGHSSTDDGIPGKGVLGWATRTPGITLVVKGSDGALMKQQ